MHETKKANDSKAMQWHREKRILEYHEKHQGEASVISFRGWEFTLQMEKGQYRTKAIYAAAGPNSGGNPEK